jgi:phosphoribosylaminoimidazolecarboxamide formyltransferase/IMP cyclohydrolase
MKRRAIISVYDKTGAVDFAKGLCKHGFEIVSTGGTAKALKEAGVEVLEVSQVTGFPECLDGRLKTLHPKLLGGILAKSSEEHMKTLEALEIAPVEIVAVNFYPFQKGQSLDIDGAVELIDIGGPTMVRAAAKSYERVTVIVDPADYEVVLYEIEQNGKVSDATRQDLMVKAFCTTALYDAHIANEMARRFQGDSLPKVFLLGGFKWRDLRYGENPHQKAAVYIGGLASSLGLAQITKLQGKEMSYNNFIDAESAWLAVREFKDPACVIVKHTNPCGVGIDKESLKNAYEKALDTDPVSAFGGIVALNREVDEELARRISEHFYEVLLAPCVTEPALKVLSQKKNLRVLELKDAFFAPYEPFVARQISGGFLVQESDPIADDISEARVVTKRAPTPEEWRALDFVWRVTKHVKSNAIVFAREDRTLAIGAGQMSRVDSAKLAVMKANQNLDGSVVGSDAFFPFPDGVEVVARAGATAIAQPGGSIRDKEVIEVADKLGLAMVFTGKRHFRH